MSGQTSAAPSKASMINQNMALRMQLLSAAQPIAQQIFTTTIAAPGNANNIVQIAPRLAGLLKRFKVYITGTANNTEATAGVAAITPLGLANLLSNVQFVDTANNTRINTSGWHLDQIATMKYGRPYGGVFGTSPIALQGLGNNFGVINKPATIAVASSEPFAAVFDVPISYSDADLRGAVNLNVTNATASLQLTLNPAPFVATGDSTLAVFSGATGTITNVTVTVFQEYLTNLPTNAAGQLILPPMDMSTVYTLLTTNYTGMVANSDFPVPYTDFRDYLSTSLIYDNGGVLNDGTDINTFSLTLANYTNLFKVTPSYVATKVREAMGFDLAPGSYYFGSRHKPISPNSFGNIELNVNPSSVAANSTLYAGFEYMSMLANIGLSSSQAAAGG